MFFDCCRPSVRNVKPSEWIFDPIEPPAVPDAHFKLEKEQG